MASLPVSAQAEESAPPEALERSARHVELGAAAFLVVAAAHLAYQYVLYGSQFLRVLFL